MGIHAQRIRLQPRISSNKLAEYIIAKPGRREQIRKDQKYPPDYIVPTYDAALDSIADFLCKLPRDPSNVLRVIDELNSSRARTQWDAMRRRVCAEALIAWLDLLDEL